MSTLVLFHWKEKIINVECDGHQISPDMLKHVLLELHEKSSKSESTWKFAAPPETELHIEFDGILDSEWLSKYGSASLQKEPPVTKG